MALVTVCKYKLACPGAKTEAVKAAMQEKTPE